MMSLRHCVSTALRSTHTFQGGLSIAAHKKYSTEIIEKAEELKLSYLTGDKQGIAVIELNREVGKNSLSKSLVKKLLHSVDVLGNDKGVRVVVIRSLSGFVQNSDLIQFTKAYLYKQSRASFALELT